MGVSFFIERLAPVHFNPLDKHAIIALSNENLTMLDTGPNGQHAVRATKSFDNGNLYYEFL